VDRPVAIDSNRISNKTVCLFITNAFNKMSRETIKNFGALLPDTLQQNFGEIARSFFVRNA
jgi:hypothetical protein